MKWIVRGIIFGLGCAIGYSLNSYRLKKIEEKNKQLEEDRKQALFMIAEAKTKIKAIKQEIERLEKEEENA